MENILQFLFLQFSFLIFIFHHNFYFSSTFSVAKFPFIFVLHLLIILPDDSHFFVSWNRYILAITLAILFKLDVALELSISMKYREFYSYVLDLVFQIWSKFDWSLQALIGIDLCEVLSFEKHTTCNSWAIIYLFSSI